MITILDDKSNYNKSWRGELRMKTSAENCWAYLLRWRVGALVFTMLYNDMSNR